jgi:hypothetical protein
MKLAADLTKRTRGPALPNQSKTEVPNQRTAMLIQQDVPRLECQVIDTETVRVLKAGRDLFEVEGCVCERDRTAVDALYKTRPLDHRAQKINRIPLQACFDGGYQVGMIQHEQFTRPLKYLPGIASIGCGMDPHDCEGNLAADAGIECLKYGRLALGDEFAEDEKAAEFSPDSLAHRECSTRKLWSFY